MRWEHRCSLDWLRERQAYITASDIKSLLPITKTGRKREVGELEYLKVMSGKMVELTEEDCLSTGAAARGHLLEPYAVEALDSMLSDAYGEKAEHFHHWDDRLISVDGRRLAFSPDAMDIPMDDPDPVHDVGAIAEIKSYGADRHIVTAYTPKDQIEERWQIASAMALLPNIDHAYLVLFNPKMEHRKLFAIRYGRAELEDEIAMVLDVERKWDAFCDAGILTRKPASGAISSGYGGTEAGIEAEIERRMSLNPR
jgi:hypothetical protein